MKERMKLRLYLVLLCIAVFSFIGTACVVLSSEVPPVFNFSPFVFLIVAGVFLGYSVYAMYSQYRFFNKWERRVGLLLHLEEEILSKKLEPES